MNLLFLICVQCLIVHVQQPCIDLFLNAELEFELKLGTWEAFSYASFFHLQPRPLACNIQKPQAR